MKEMARTYPKLLPERVCYLSVPFLFIRWEDFLDHLFCLLNAKKNR